MGYGDIARASTRTAAQLAETHLVNPKDVEARKSGKAPLDLLEPAAEREIARALAFGASKYGTRNYVESPISARVYVAAMKRHIDAWLEGEDCAEDSGVHHLGHIGANVHVALAAIAGGTFIDDRHGKPEPKPPTGPCLRRRALDCDGCQPGATRYCDEAPATDLAAFGGWGGHE